MGRKDKIMKKFKLTREKMKVDGRTLYRIKATKSFGTGFNRVERGDLGGWVGYDDNLSQYGDCWIHDDAKVYDSARIRNDAQICCAARVYSGALVCGSAKVSGYTEVGGDSEISGHAMILENATISGHVEVFGNATVRGNATISGSAHIGENAIIESNAIVDCDSVVAGNASIRQSAVITKTRDVLTIGPVGSRDGYTTFYKSATGIMVSCGCFNDNIDAFYRAVLDTHRDNETCKNEYLNIIEYVKRNF